MGQPSPLYRQPLTAGFIFLSLLLVAFSGTRAQTIAYFDAIHQADSLTRVRQCEKAAACDSADVDGRRAEMGLPPLKYYLSLFQ